MSSVRADRNGIFGCRLDDTSCDGTVLFFLTFTFAHSTHDDQLNTYLKCRTDEMRKVVRACITNETGFSAPSDAARNAKVKYFLALLCASNRDLVSERPYGLCSLLIVIQVIQGIVEIIQLHLFRELLWIALLRPVKGLDDNSQDGRIGDLFPEEIREQGYLSKGVVGTLMTLVGFFLHTFGNDYQR
jgi:hypothetical protein